MEELDTSSVPENSIISKDLIQAIHDQFALEWDGIHGAAHWARVRRNGLELATQTHANLQVVELFAFLHDSKRENNGFDQDHGQRAADFARTIRDLIPLKDDGLDLLLYACARHTDGLTEADITVQTCWDADRLDLGRVGIRPSPKYLCTPAAKDSDRIEKAWQESLRLFRQKSRNVL